ncbi:MAG: hypothetical protein WC506_05405 [Candidatus Micrarchaeia archaeon]
MRFHAGAIAFSAVVFSLILAGCSQQQPSFAQLLSQRHALPWNATYSISSGIEGAANSSARLLSSPSGTLWSFKAAGNEISNYALAGRYYSCSSGESGTACFASSKEFGIGPAAQALADFEANAAAESIAFDGEKDFNGLHSYCFSGNASASARVTDCLADSGMPVYQRVDTYSSPYAVSYIREAASMKKEPVSISAPPAYSYVEIPGIGGHLEGGIGLDCVQTCGMAGSQEEITFCLHLCIE